VVEVLKQPQYRPLPAEREVVRIWVATGGHLDEYPVADAARFVEGFAEFLETRHAGILEAIRTTGDLTDDADAELRSALDGFRQTFVPSGTEPGSEAGRGEGTPRDEVKPDVGWDRMSSEGDEEDAAKAKRSAPTAEGKEEPESESESEEAAPMAQGMEEPGTPHEGDAAATGETPSG
jgi:hypothetical protein